MGIYKPVINISGSAVKLLNDAGNAPSSSCRASVNFNGTGTVAIRGSKNISSITDNGTGNYTANFSTAMSDVNYVGIATSSSNATKNATSTANLTTGFQILTRDYTNTSQDAETVSISIF